MKKILFLLLLTVASYGQVSTGQETEFDYGIKNNSTQTITTPTYLTTTGTDGTQGKIPSAYIEKTDNKQNSLAVDGTGTKYPTVDAVNAALPKTYTTTVYVNTNDPNTATVFDDENPPVTNDDALKINTANLYIGNDASTWVYKTSPAGYVTEIVSSSTSNFYTYGTTTDAGSDKNAQIYRNGSVAIMNDIISSKAVSVRSYGSDTAQNGGRFSLMRPDLAEGNTFQLNASNGLDLWNYASGVWNKRFTFSSAGDFNSKGNITGGLKVRKISTNTMLADSDNGTIILLTASCTVTLPNGLMSGFNCSFSTQTGVTMTYALGGSVTLINNAGTTMAEKLSHTIVNTGTSNEYLTAGSL